MQCTDSPILAKTAAAARPAGPHPTIKISLSEIFTLLFYG
tara:strand:- start:547 stop:666 length:120 start_codon:yes stop_codon:yes gene_type:complete